MTLWLPVFNFGETVRRALSGRMFLFVLGRGVRFVVVLALTDLGSVADGYVADVDAGGQRTATLAGQSGDPVRVD